MLKDSIRLLPASKGISELRDRFSRPLQVVVGMLTIGRLLVCINLGSLQIARSDESRREFSIRLAIGASRFRIIRQCLVEMMLLALVSGCLALLAFKPIAAAVASMMTIWGNLPAHLSLRLDTSLLAFLFLSCSTVAGLCGWLPALYATRRKRVVCLQSGCFTTAGQRRPASLLRTIGGLQVAFSLIMITATCLFALNLGTLRHFDGGINRDRLLSVEVDASAAGYSEQRAVLLDQQLCARFATLSGVAQATYSANGIYSGRNSTGTFSLDTITASVPENNRYGVYDYVGPNFFTTLGTTILAGRDFSDHDTASATPVVIVNQALAERFFSHRNPVGQNFYVSDGNSRKAYQIIGVVRDVRANPRTAPLAWYFAAIQHQVHPFSTCFLIRTGRKIPAAVTAIRTVLHDEDPQLEIANLQTANQLFENTVQTDRLLATLGWAFGLLAILLASAGIYGLLSYDVARRHSEFGILTAVGARPIHIAKLLLSQAAIIVALGLLSGAGAANLLTRLVYSLVFEMRASDPRIELTAGLVLLAVAMAAAWHPIRRAARLDPMRALRTE
jgi:predicted permease